jgi:hypothetical protein
MLETFKKMTREIFGVYLFWIIAHWISSKVYVKLCVGDGLYDIIMSPFMVPLQHCVMMRWMIYNGGRTIEVMWILGVKWTIEKLILYKIYSSE